jgi:hypothetical protein
MSSLKSVHVSYTTNEAEAERRASAVHSVLVFLELDHEYDYFIKFEDNEEWGPGYWIGIERLER